jgi:hypothetical protein
MGAFPSAVAQNQGRQPDPTEIMGNALKLRQAMTIAPVQQQQAQQNLQASQLENQQRGQAVQQGQLDLDSQKAIHRAYMETNGDLEKAVPLAAQYGAKPDALIKLKEASIKQQSDNLALFKSKGELASQQADLMQGAHDAVTQAKPEDKAAVYSQQVQALGQRGVDTSQFPQQYPGDKQFEFIGAGLKGHAQMMKELTETAGLQKTQAETAKIQNESAFGPVGPAAEGRYRFILAKLAAKQPVSQADTDWARAYEASESKSTTTSDSLGVTSSNSSRPTGLASVGQRGAPGGGGGTSKPAAQSTKDSLIDTFGQYKADPAMLSRMMMKHPEIMGAIAQKYPDFDQTNYTAKAALIKGYTSGSQSKEINAINTAMGHLKNLDDAIDALHNGNATALNKIGAYYNINLGGKTAEAAFKLIADKVGSEVSGAYIPGGGGVQERIANREDYNVNLPPQTLHNNAAVTTEMLRSKIGALENQYKNTVGRDDFAKRFISPAAQAALDKFAQRGGSKTNIPPAASGMINVKMSDGRTGTIKATSKDKFLQDNPGSAVIQ